MNVLRLFDPWRGPLCTCPKKYSLHPYTGCSHFCLYCYATSYLGRKPSKPKNNFISRLLSDIKKADKRIPVELSTSSDPYPPIEETLALTRRTLDILKRAGFKTLITTKGTGFTRDEGLFDALMVTVTTLDKDIYSKMEPGAPSPIKRLEAMNSVKTGKGIRVDPIIPLLNDDLGALREILRIARDYGASHVVFSTYKVKPDNFKRMVEAFPELEKEWRELYFKEGYRIGGYRYLPAKIRRKILEPLVEEATRLGMSAALCREGFQDLHRAKSCDGTHLIRER